MGGNNFLNILKTITEAMKCPNCEHAYVVEEVQFISQMEGYSLVHLTCSHCQKPVWVNFFSTEQKPNFKLEYLERNGADLEEISSNEVIDFHNSLINFDGDFRRAFGR
jgi:hypothetical protein